MKSISKNMEKKLNDPKHQKQKALKIIYKYL